MNKVVIFSAPSGSGKTTIVSYMLREFSNLRFSVSATSRAPRGSEIDGVDYHFLSQAQFADFVSSGKFVEWQEVYPGTCYGTLKSEVDRIWNEGNVVVFDVDVVGGVNLKKIFGAAALSIFIMPPSVEVLRQRLIGRATDSEQAIERRVAKAESEIGYAPEFDSVIVNDDLQIAISETSAMLTSFLH